MNFHKLLKKPSTPKNLVFIDFKQVVKQNQTKNKKNYFFYVLNQRWVNYGPPALTETHENRDNLPARAVYSEVYCR